MSKPPARRTPIEASAALAKVEPADRLLIKWGLGLQPALDADGFASRMEAFDAAWRWAFAGVREGGPTIRAHRFAKVARERGRAYVQSAGGPGRLAPGVAVRKAACDLWQAIGELER